RESSKGISRRELRKNRIDRVGRRSISERRVRLVQTRSDVDAPAAYRPARGPGVLRGRAYVALVRLDAGRARIRQSRGSRSERSLGPHYIVDKYSSCEYT